MARALTAVGQAVRPLQTLVLSPNPASDMLTVYLPEIVVENGTLSVFDSKGMIIKTLPAKSATYLQLATGEWQPGVYFVVFKSEKMVATGRFVKG